MDQRSTHRLQSTAGDDPRPGLARRAVHGHGRGSFERQRGEEKGVLNDDTMSLSGSDDVVSRIIIVVVVDVAILIEPSRGGNGRRISKKRKPLLLVVPNDVLQLGQRNIETLELPPR